MKDIVVSVKDVSIRFNLASEKVDSIKEYVVKRMKRQVRFDEFYALRHVSLEIERGEAFAIVGENGCGKSTLLKTISGIYFPTTGSMEKSGNIAPLIELGAGFDMDLTARENIFLNGALMGYSRDFMQDKFQEILDFSELWEFIDVPIKNFSSGMIARLGFSIATMVTPDILIVDEILAVGDFMFQEKCERKIQAMLAEGTTLIFVSHSAEQVKKLCSRGIWLVHGVPQMVGTAQEVCTAYEAYMRGDAPLPEAEDAPEAEQEQQPAPIVGQEKKRYSFIAWLRVLALLMVVYDHTVPFILRGMGVEWAPMNAVTKFLVQPFGVIQDFGFLGVCLFFLISGYLMSDTLLTQPRSKWLVRRVTHIWGAMLVSAAGLFCLQAAVGAVMGTPTYWAQFGVVQWIKSIFLLPYFLGQSEPIWGITWFLAPLFLFYAWSALLQPLFQKHPKRYFALVSLLLVLNMTLLPTMGDIAYSIAHFQSYLAILCIGQLFSTWLGGRISQRCFALCAALLTLLSFAGSAVFYPGSLTGEELRLPNIIYALFIFLVAFLLRDCLPDSAVIKWVGKISLPLYLCHLQVAQLLLPYLIPMLGTTVTMAVTYTAIALLAWAESLVLQPMENTIQKMTR